MNLHLHDISPDLMRRAKARAAQLGMTLKDWVIGLLHSALGDTQPMPHKSTSVNVPRSPTPVPPPPIDSHVTVSRGPVPASPSTSSPTPPVGRRDLLPPGGSK